MIPLGGWQRRPTGIKANCEALSKIPLEFLYRQERHAKNMALGDPFDDAANRFCLRLVPLFQFFGQMEPSQTW